VEMERIHRHSPKALDGRNPSANIRWRGLHGLSHDLGGGAVMSKRMENLATLP